MSWLEGDIRILAAGMAIGGRFNQTGLIGKQAFEPKIWLDDGQFDHFYIDLQKQLRDFSYGQLQQSIYVVSPAGQIIQVTGSQKDGTVVRMEADISGIYGDITVIGVANGWLFYESGKRVPAFSVNLRVDRDPPYVDMAYLYDVIDFPQVFGGNEETVSVLHYGVHTREMIREEIAFPALFDVSEDVAVSFFKNE